MRSCTVQGCEGEHYARGLCGKHYARLRTTGTTDDPPSRRRTCTVDGCAKPAVGRGLCQMHYTRWKKTGEPGDAKPKHQPRGSECSVDSCTKPVYGRTWCVKHYENNRLRGDPLAEGRGQGWNLGNKKWDGQTCSVDGCDRPVRFIGLCGMHCARVQRFGEPGQAEPLIAPRGSGYVTPDGYREISIAGERVLEHRYVMTQMLGRPLSGDENVHHINGDRSDNRPENLELWVTAQPPRQNVEDLVAWARQILSDYEGDVKQLQLFHDPPKRRKRTTATT